MLFFSTAHVILESSLGTGRACPDEMVTYTCTVTEGESLSWTAIPRFPVDSVFGSPSPIISTLKFNFTASLNGTVVQCAGTNETTNSTINIAGTLFVAVLFSLTSG